MVDEWTLLLTLFASSSAVGMSYLSLPDYRYRNRITEYFESEFKIRDFSDKDVGNYTLLDDDGKIVPENLVTIIRACSQKETVEEKVRRILTEAEHHAQQDAHWLTFLKKLMQMPKGHNPTDLEIFKFKKIPNIDPNWFQTFWGKWFVRLYLRHWDNWICLATTLISFLFTIILFYSPETATIIESTAWVLSYVGEVKLMSLVGSLGVLCLAFPATLAFVGRIFICASARTAILRGVTTLFETHLMSLNEYPISGGDHAD